MFVHPPKIALALLGCTLSSVTLAAPKRTAPKKAAVKRTLSANELRARQEIKRMWAAYRELGFFSVSSDDSIRTAGVRNAFRAQSVGSFGTSGRLSIRTEMSIQEPVFQKLQFAHLYDLKQCRFWRSDRKDSVMTKAELNKHPDHMKSFFEPSIALHLIHAGVRGKVANDVLDKEKNIKGQLKFVELPGGASRIESRTTSKEKGMEVNRTLLITIGADGFLQRLEAKEMPVGSKALSFYDNAVVSHPTRGNIDAAFNWNLLKYPEPQVMGQTGEIPPVVPEKGQMPGVIVVE